MRHIPTTRNTMHLGVTTALALVLAAGAAPAWGATTKITDANVRDAVEDAIFFDKAVPFDKIDVTCNDGVVSLTGKTNNLLAKHRAARLAETIKGVRSVVNRIDVKPPKMRTANEIKRDVEGALLSDPATDSYEVVVMANSDGRVTLSGTVESWQEKQLVDKVTKSVRGVTEVDNNLSVDYRVERADYEIVPEIEQALRWNALVSHNLIDVSVDDGKVTLSGTVGSAAEKRQARYDAWVAGVTDVDDSQLKVREWAHDSDRREATLAVDISSSAISKAVDAANTRDPRVSSFNVTSVVDGSVVTLRGKVDNLKAKQAAAENARNTVGVSRVVNRLKVCPTQDPSATELESAVADALRRDPYVDRYEIDVNVVDDTAYLAGTVDSYFEKAQAEDAAARVNGVVSVSNAILVADTSWPIVYDPYVYDWYAYDYGWYDYEPTLAIETDADIRDEIQDEMWWSPFVDSDEVSVTVNDGIATLTGTVDSWTERRVATGNALEGGAISVNNNLSVVMQ